MVVTVLHEESGEKKVNCFGLIFLVCFSAIDEWGCVVFYKTYSDDNILLLQDQQQKT